MISQEELDDAVIAGAISAEAALALRRHVASRRGASEADEEHFRLLTGFNDIFVVIAGLLVLLSLRWLVNALTLAPLGDLAMSAIAWGLAELFVRRRRLALPAIVLTVAWLAGLATVAFELAGHPLRWPAATCAAAIAAALHWRRFRVPITWAAAAAVLALALGKGLLSEWQMPALVLAGLATLAAAVGWDISDRLRRTRRADVAFWLHLLAAPLLVHSSFALLGVLKASPAGWQVLAIGFAYVALACVSLVLDRRALMVSALGYLLFAAVVVMKEQTGSDAAMVSIPLLVGLLLLALSAHWEQVRSRIVTPLPVGLRQKLAPVRTETA